MSPFVSISCGGPLPIIFSTKSTSLPRCFSTPFASLASPQSPPPPPQPKSKSNLSSSQTPFSVDSSSKTSDFALQNPNGTNPALQSVRSTESDIERVIFDFRFLALLAVAGSLAGSLLCFLDGCVYVMDAYKIYWTSCLRGALSGKMVMRLVEAIGCEEYTKKRTIGIYTWSSLASPNQSLWSPFCSSQTFLLKESSQLHDQLLSLIHQAS
ncbi:hypothetical protein LXL04_034110 [Taraxacum kok-saghyz]